MIETLTERQRAEHSIQWFILFASGWRRLCSQKYTHEHSSCRVVRDGMSVHCWPLRQSEEGPDQPDQDVEEQEEELLDGLWFEDKTPIWEGIVYT